MYFATLTFQFLLPQYPLGVTSLDINQQASILRPKQDPWPAQEINELTRQIFQKDVFYSQISSLSFHWRTVSLLRIILDCFVYFISRILFPLCCEQNQIPAPSLPEHTYIFYVRRYKKLATLLGGYVLMELRE